MQIIHRLKRAVFSILSALICLLVLAPATGLAADITQPAEFYGTVTINGLPAPVGTLIIAKIGSVERGRLTTTVAGQYGGSATFAARLVVSGQQAEISQTITFYINNNKANQTAAFTPGQSAQLALSAQSYPIGAGDAPVTKALAYLKQAQQPNGSIGGFVPSSWVVLAIVAAGQDPHAWTVGNNSIVSYLRDNAAANLDSNKATDWERSILAIVAAKENPRSFGGIDYVAKLLSFYDGTQMGDPALLNDDCWGIMALKMVGEGQQAIPNIVNYIKSKQNTDGGWGWTVGGASDADNTAAAISAMIAGGEPSASPNIVNAVNYIKSQQQSNGGFSSQGTTNSGVDGWVIRALRDLGQSPTGDAWQNTGNNPLGHLLSLQDADGSFKYTVALKSNPEWMTAYGIPALLGAQWPKDTVPPVISNLSPVSGANISSSSQVISAAYSDTISGINQTTAKLFVDSIDVTASAAVTVASISYNAANLINGTHSVRVVVSDKAGNPASQTWNFQVVVNIVDTDGTLGGGGGGGGIITPTPTPTPLPQGTTNVASIVNINGVFTQNISVQPQDLKVSLNIASGVKALTSDNRPLSQLSIVSLASPPAPPAQVNFVGTAYDFGPGGATFNPPITLTYKYDMSQIPQGVVEKNLVMAIWDSTAGRWVELESVVDTQAKTVTAKTSHFCAFAVLAHTRPANFALSNLSVSPLEVSTKETVNINAVISNNGDVSGFYDVTLSIDNIVVQSKKVSVAGGSQAPVSFIITADKEGSHSFNLGDLNGTFKVKPLPAPEIPVPAVNKLSMPVAAGEPPTGSVSELSQSEPSSVNWLIIGGAIAGVLVIGLLFVLLRRGGIRTRPSGR